MNIRQLSYFIAVAEELSFRAAAQRLNVSQPPVSVQIRDLEAQLGVRLLERSTQKVTLTEAGTIFLGRARAIIRSLEETRHDMTMLAGGTRALRLGYMSAAMLHTLSPLLGPLAQLEPRVTLGLHQMPPDDQLRAIARGDLDAGLVDFSAGRGRLGVEDKTLHIETAWREPLVAAVSREHPMAKMTLVDPADLAEETLIVLARNPFFGFYDHVIELVSQPLRRAPRMIEARDLPQVLALVGAGFGVSITPSRSSAPWRDLLAFVPIVPGLQTEVCLVHRSDSDDPVLGCLKAALHTLEP